CPAPDDETRYADGDLAKLDIGVHLDGYVVDTALTVNVGARPENQPLVAAAEAALRAAIAASRPHVEIRVVAEAIEAAIRSHGFRPIRNLCGHGVARWTVHGPPPVPNVAHQASGELMPGRAVAIEPFATDGAGFAVEQGEAQVFRVVPE